MKKLSEVDKSLCDELQMVADENKALLLSFIAPDKIVRKSPISYDYATITVQDLYNIEKTIEGLKDVNNLPKKLHIIIQTPGGDVYAATKIVKYLQKNFVDIEAYVPYEASSGGTMMCLAANIIVMHSTSSLSPIDPQVRYKNQRVSALTFEQAIEEFQDKFGKYRPEEIPSPYQQLCNQFDPVIAKEMKKVVYDSISFAHQTLTKSQKPKTKEEKERVLEAVFNLAKTYYPHTHIITVDEAKRFGLNIDESPDKLKLLKVYKKWVSKRLLEEETSHIIESFYPTKAHENTQKSQSTANETTSKKDSNKTNKR